MDIDVKSAVIDWQAQTLLITSQMGEKHSIPLTTNIHVVMIGEQREEANMEAAYLGQYMSRGYIIEQVSFEVEAVLSLICQRCSRVLMQQKTSCVIGSYATINIDELAQFAGPCCNKPKRTARVEFVATGALVESMKEEDR